MAIYLGSGPSGEVHQVHHGDGQRGPAADGAGEQDGERDDRPGPHRRRHHRRVEGRAERVLGRPAGADGDAQADADRVPSVAQVLHRLQRGTRK